MNPFLTICLYILAVCGVAMASLGTLCTFCVVLHICRTGAATAREARAKAALREEEVRANKRRRGAACITESIDSREKRL